VNFIEASEWLLIANRLGPTLESLVLEYLVIKDLGPSACEQRNPISFTEANLYRGQTTDVKMILWAGFRVWALI
jgi:hypothetical protein